METLSLRRAFLFVLAGLVLQGGVATQSRAQDKFVAGGELPAMAMMVCKSFDAALAHAKASRDLGLLSLEEAKASSVRAPDCRALRVRARPYVLENVAPYLAWAVTYDRLSPVTVEEAIEGRSYPVNYSYKLQLHKIYKAVVTDRNNESFEAWIELPERPYFVEFLKAQKGPSR